MAIYAAFCGLRSTASKLKSSIQRSECNCGIFFCEIASITDRPLLLKVPEDLQPGCHEWSKEVVMLLLLLQGFFDHCTPAWPWQRGRQGSLNPAILLRATLS